MWFAFWKEGPSELGGETSGREREKKRKGEEVERKKNAIFRPIKAAVPTRKELFLSGAFASSLGQIFDLLSPGARIRSGMRHVAEKKEEERLGFEEKQTPFVFLISFG